MQSILNLRVACLVAGFCAFLTAPTLFPGIMGFWNEGNYLVLPTEVVCLEPIVPLEGVEEFQPEFRNVLTSPNLDSRERLSSLEYFPLTTSLIMNDSLEAGQQN